MIKSPLKFSALLPRFLVSDYVVFFQEYGLKSAIFLCEYTKPIKLPGVTISHVVKDSDCCRIVHHELHMTLSDLLLKSC